ncbi:carbohydrate kinase family protein [Patescibacteria group bacterium]|nr:carbohydrate kinase family protein [Patescibacteria group bacterium]
MHDVTTIGSATVDIFMKSPDFQLQPTQEGVLLCQTYGGKIDVDEFFWQSGGAGTNTAVGFSRMGFRTAAVVEIGKDIFGQNVYDELQKEHVDTNYIVSEVNEQTAVSTVLISGQGGRSILTHRGASGMLEARDVPWDLLQNSRWVHLSNVSANTELLFQLFDHIRSSLIGLSWNPGRKELELIADGKIQPAHIPCDILMMNKEEWEILKPVQEVLIENIEQVVITDGKNGGNVYMKHHYDYQYKASEVKAVQETGAGDAFLVGYVSAHILGKDIEEACQWGVKNASSVIQNMGAKTGLLHRRDFSM